MSRSLLVLACAVALLSSSVSNPVAAEKPAAKKPATDAAKKPAPDTAKKPASKATKNLPLAVGEAAIENALATPTAIEFIDAPLSDVIDYLKERHHIEIQLDKKAFDEVGVGVETPITKNLRGVSLRSALNLMLRDLNLTWIIKDEVLLITTPEHADDLLTTKVIDVSDLVVCRKDDGQLWDDYDTLIDVIATTVLPTSWDSAGGPGSISGAGLGTAKVLIISQKQKVHEEIASLLADIRKIAKKNPKGELPQRDESIVRPKPDLGGLGEPEDEDNSPEATEEPFEEHHAPAPEAPKKPAGHDGGKPSHGPRI
jgi:hypothetical protein